MQCHSSIWFHYNYISLTDSHASILPFPFHRLYIGLGLGIPIIILIVVAVVVTYCCCVHHQNHKMALLLRAYNSRCEEEGRLTFDSSNAPPPYEQAEDAHDNQARDVELPAYTENDPYSLAQREEEGRDKEGEGERGVASPGEGEQEAAHHRQGSTASSEQGQPNTDTDTAPLI